MNCRGHRPRPVVFGPGQRQHQRPEWRNAVPRPRLESAWIKIKPRAISSAGSISIAGPRSRADGNASYERGAISPVLNYTVRRLTYSPGSVTFATVNSTDVLAIKDAFKQYDPNYPTNEYGNWVGNPGNTGYADPTKLITAPRYRAGRGYAPGRRYILRRSSAASGRSIAASFRSAPSWRIRLPIRTRLQRRFGRSVWPAVERFGLPYA